MNRLLLLLGLAWRTRVRGLISAGPSSIVLILGGLFYLATTCAVGVAAYVALSQSHGARIDRVGNLAALVVTLLGVFFFTRPLILTNLAGGSLRHLLHLPLTRSELLAYSLLTGVFTPLVLESPVLIGAALGAAVHPGLALLTLPLALLTHLTLLAGAHCVSLFAVFIARRAWVADLARLLAISVFFLPAVMGIPGVRSSLGPLLAPLIQISPLGWAARATIYAGGGEVMRSVWFGAPALLVLLAIAFTSATLLNRILVGESDARSEENQRVRPARILLPGALGAMIETQWRTQLRSPAARMALMMPALMMGFFALSLARPGAMVSPFAMVVFMSVVGGNAFLSIGRGVALILGTHVSRAWILVAADASSLPFRVLPLLAIIGVTAWRAGVEAGVSMAALALALVPCGMGVQHFVSILRPFALPHDRLNPYAQRVDSRQTGSGLVSLLATLATALIASPFLMVQWLSSRIAQGAYQGWLLALSCLGALAIYAVLIALAERLLERRELQVLEILLDDSPA